MALVLAVTSCYGHAGQLSPHFLPVLVEEVPVHSLEGCFHQEVFFLPDGSKSLFHPHQLFVDLGSCCSHTPVQGGFGNNICVRWGGPGGHQGAGLQSRPVHGTCHFISVHGIPAVAVTHGRVLRVTRNKNQWRKGSLPPLVALPPLLSPGRQGQQAAQPFPGSSE